MSTKRLLARALAREKLPRPPVWLMRQAGRYLPEYRAVREQAGGFLQMIRNPEFAAEVTLQPVRRFGLDAAILFSDILVPLEAMGMELVFDERGPHLPHPLRSQSDIARLSNPVPAESMAFVGEALRLVRRDLPEATSLIGFCGAPFTLASYAIEGGTGKTFSHLRALMYHDERGFGILMDKLAATVTAHLAYQIECGAEAVVLFDTWASALGREDYQRYAMPWSKRILESLPAGTPRVVFAGAADHLLLELASLPAEALAIDHRTSIDSTFRRFGEQRALQGNLDPAVLLATPEEVHRRTRALLKEVGGRAGHILNLGHGVIKDTDPACVAAFVAAAREPA
ncbi:MAG: uroporphyrinogen decarboxylase [Planctomycetota bacterium]